MKNKIYELHRSVEEYTWVKVEARSEEEAIALAQQGEFIETGKHDYREDFEVIGITDKDYVTLGNDTSKANGTSLKGYINASFDKLVKLFGDYHSFDDHKVDAEWCLEFTDGTIATIYNYKNGYNYLGKYGTPLEDMTEWHVGGFTDAALTKVAEILEDSEVLAKY